MELEQLLTTEEVAAYLRVPIATIRYWRSVGGGPAGFRAGRRVVYRVSAIDKWLADRARVDGPTNAG